MEIAINVSAIAELVNYGSLLLSNNSDSAKLDSQILLAFVLDKPLSYLLSWPEKQVDSEKIQQFAGLLSRRNNNEPIAYIVGVKEFWSLELMVSPATLIPRPDTETLVELVLNQLSHHSTLTCLDLGTGTGAIALALASEQPNWKIDAIDFNHDAVELAQKNAQRLNLSHVNIFQSDWFDQIPSKQRYQIIVSNPPYIDSTDPHLMDGDVCYEPKSALVADNQGLADIIHIAENARKYLAPNGQLYFEHGYQQGKAVREIFEKLGYAQPSTEIDLNGNDRITWATYP